MNYASSQLKLQAECVFSSDIDPAARESYQLNFDLLPAGDITAIDAASIPAYDVLLAGFPCQAFSIIGDRKGFNDTRGTLFFDVARVLESKKPLGFVLENVKQLTGHDKGRTIGRISGVLTDLGYQIEYKVLNALDFGLPQKRERVFIIGWLGKLNFDWSFPSVKMAPLADILEKEVGPSYFASDTIRKRRLNFVKRHQLAEGRPTIWHENKSGNISAYEYSCALRAGASYNYLLVNGDRRPTEREMLRLQGFPDTHIVTHSYSKMKRFAGNALPIPIASAVISRLLELNLRKANGNTSRATPEAGSKDKSSLSSK